MFRVHAKFMTRGLYRLHTSAHLSGGRVGEGLVGAGGRRGAKWSSARGAGREGGELPAAFCDTKNV